MKLVTTSKNGLVTSLVMGFLRLALGKHLNRFTDPDILPVIYIHLTPSLFESISLYYEENGTKPSNVVLVSELKRSDPGMLELRQGVANREFNWGNTLVVLIKDNDYDIGTKTPTLAGTVIIEKRLNQKKDYLEELPTNAFVKKLMEWFNVSFVTATSLYVRAEAGDITAGSIPAFSYYGLLEAICERAKPAIRDSARIQTSDDEPNAYALLLDKHEEIVTSKNKASVSRPIELAITAIRFIACRPDLYGNVDWTIDRTDNLPK